MKKNKVFCKKQYLLCVIASISFLLAGCSMDTGTYLGPSQNSYTEENAEEQPKLEFDAMLYDNDGNNFVTFRGNSFNITPNKVKQYGYNTEGSWTYWFDTSSVVTVDIDGHCIHSCGSTILFKDTRIEIQPLEEDIGTLQSSGDNENISAPSDYSFKDWYKLKFWWADYKEKGQGDNVMIIIQSQNGKNIGVVTGEDIKWEVAGKLPKTTLITIDGDKQLYLHRCNFTIIDLDLFENLIEE